MIDDYQARKAERVSYYKNFVEGWKFIPCQACSGTGLYDDTNWRGHQPKCGNCKGTGKERVSPKEYKWFVEFQEGMRKPK